MNEKNETTAAAVAAVAVTDAEDLYHAVNADGYHLSDQAVFGFLANWESIRDANTLKILGEMVPLPVMADETPSPNASLVAAAHLALQVLEKIRTENPELIADSLPKGWGMKSIRAAITNPVIESKEFSPTSILPMKHLIVEVIYESGATGFSWREGDDDAAGCDAFDYNDGKVLGWRFLQPGQTVDRETLRLHGEMLSRISGDSANERPRCS